MSLLVLALIAVNTVLLAMEYHDEELCDEMEDRARARADLEEAGEVYYEEK